MLLPFLSIVSRSVYRTRNYDLCEVSICALFVNFKLLLIQTDTIFFCHFEFCVFACNCFDSFIHSFIWRYDILSQQEYINCCDISRFDTTQQTKANSFTGWHSDHLSSFFCCFKCDQSNNNSICTHSFIHMRQKNPFRFLWAVVFIGFQWSFLFHCFSSMAWHIEPFRHIEHIVRLHCLPILLYIFNLDFNLLHGYMHVRI